MAELLLDIYEYRLQPNGHRKEERDVAVLDDKHRDRTMKEKVDSQIKRQH